MYVGLPIYAGCQPGSVFLPGFALMYAKAKPIYIYQMLQCNQLVYLLHKEIYTMSLTRSPWHLQTPDS